MESFYWIVLMIAVVFMIIGLTASAMMLQHQSAEEVFPKSHSPCPDGWESDPTYANSCKLPYGAGNGYGNNNAGTPEERKKSNMGTFDNKQMIYNDTAIFNIDAYHDADGQIAKDHGPGRAGATIHYNIVKSEIEKHGQLKLLQFPDTISRCQKKEWANHHGIKWDGITNYNNCK